MFFENNNKSPLPPLVDSHCHLDYLMRDGNDLNDVIARAMGVGVQHLLTISTRLSTFPTILAIAEKFDNVTCTVGVHPHESEEESDEIIKDYNILCDFCAHPKVVGIGETGLDYYYNHSDKDKQIASFRAHIRAAQATNLPLIVHSRDADDDTINILRDEYNKQKFKGLIHCFSSSKWLADEAMKMGFYISISGIVTFKKSEDLQNIVCDLPLDKLLIETDSPYLAPVPFRGKKNEPAYVLEVAKKIAKLKNISLNDICEKSCDNFFTLFDKHQK